MPAKETTHSKPAATRLQVLITAGAEDPHRARQGLETALAAIALGASVTVFLTVRGAFWAERRTYDTCVVPGCDTIPSIIADLLEMGATVECCSACARQFTSSCQAGSSGMLEGIGVGGLATMLERTLSGTPTITF